MMTEVRPIALTPRRREALVQVQRRLVQYRTGSADFIVDGAVIGGWDRRTYSDVRRAGLITYTDGKGDRSVRLTKAGEKALELPASDDDTPSEDSP